jgi:hypothetical protein
MGSGGVVAGVGRSVDIFGGLGLVGVRRCSGVVVDGMVGRGRESGSGRGGIMINPEKKLVELVFVPFAFSKPFQK